MAKIVPTILTSDEQEYHDRLLMAEYVSDLIQIDVIDGKFAKNMTVGVDIIKKYFSSSMLEIQLMVLFPRNYISELSPLEYVSRIIVPFEVESDLHEAIYQIKNVNKQAGLSINPATPVGAVSHLFSEIDLLLVLAVEPGFSGQKFQESSLDKVREAKKMAPELPVEVDGGVTFDNAQKIAQAGADFLAANSVLYNTPDFYLAYEKLAKIAQNLDN